MSHICNTLPDINAPRTQSLRDRVLFGGFRGTATAPVGRRGYLGEKISEL